MAEDNGTPLVNELESGPWPSFVKQIKEMAATNKLSAGLIKQLERSYEDSCSHWKHGGIVGVMGYGGGVIGRYSDLAEEIPDVAAFHTYRVNQPAGWFYSTEALRGVCDIWEKRGSGLTNIHGSTGDLVLLGGKTEEIENCFADLTKIKFDLGGSGSDVRTPSCCVGQARCEWACYDTMAFTQDITMTYQDELHRPAFPYKWKFKAAGCPNDCVASIARSDLSIIGTWKDDIQIDQDAVAEYLSQGEVDVQKNVINRCPTKCMSLDGKKLKINNSYCNRCMHCINKMPKALRPGKERGATILIGGKAPIIEGARLASVIIPFSPMEPPYQDIKDLCEKIWDLWGEHGKNRERVGEFMTRWGVGRFLEAIGVTPDPRMIKHPRDNPYIFYEEYYEEEETEEEA